MSRQSASCDTAPRSPLASRIGFAPSRSGLLAAIVDRHGDHARVRCDRVCDRVLEASPDLIIVQAANDDAEHGADLCRCPACEGCDDRGEGGA